MSVYLLSRTVVACFVMLLLSAVASAETVYFDDFSDGSVTNGTPLDRDGIPVVWTPLPGFDQGTGNAATGDFVLTTNSGEGAFASLTSHGPLSDTSVRAQMRLLDGAAAIAVFARGNAAALTAYQAGISTITGNAYIVRNTPTPIPLVVKPAILDVSTSDVLIQFDTIGESLRLFLWSPGTPKPDEPFIEIQDSTLNSGVTGVLLDSADASATGVFRFVHVADVPIPEPSSCALAVLACAGRLGFIRRRPLRPRR